MFRYSLRWDVFNLEGKIVSGEDLMEKRMRREGFMILRRL